MFIYLALQSLAPTVLRRALLCMLRAVVAAAALAPVVPAMADAADDPCAAPARARPAVVLNAQQVAHWRADLQLYQQELERRHIDLYHRTDRARFSARLAALRTALPSSTEPALIVALMRLTRSIGDGHTAIPLWQRPDCRYPLEFRLFDGVPYVTGASPEQAHLLGSRLLAIDGQSAPVILGQLAEVVQFVDNAYSSAWRSAQQLSNADVLAGLGVTATAASARFTFEKERRRIGATLTATLRPAIERRSSGNAAHFSAALGGDTRIDFAARDAGKTVYIGFRRYPDQPAMTEFCQQLRDYIHAKQTRHLIIDLRGNSGGDFFTGLMLAQTLVDADSIDWKQGVFVLTDHGTFSAAMSNAAQFSQVLNARRIGQPTGGKPSGYQDLGEFLLPNSGLQVTYSKRLYRFHANAADALWPDVLIDVNSDQHAAGVDPVLDYVLGEIGASGESGAPGVVPAES